MPNKISGLSGNPATSVAAGRPAEKARDAATGGSSAQGEAPAGGGDLHITDSATQLASLAQAMRGLPAVDAGRVAQLSSAIEQGTYTVIPQHVADKLMQFEHALGQLPGE